MFQQSNTLRISQTRKQASYKW